MQGIRPLRPARLRASRAALRNCAVVISVVSGANCARRVFLASVSLEAKAESQSITAFAIAGLT